MHLFISLIFLWISRASCQDDGQQFVWLPYAPVAVGGSGNDGVISSELAEGEIVTIKASLTDNDQSKEVREEATNPPRHERVQVTTGPEPTDGTDRTDRTEYHQVDVQEWLPTTTQASEDLINKANEVSAPWYDVMLAGLPPAVAYDWRFLVDMSEKLKTAPRKSSNDDSRAIYKYLLKRVTQTPTTKSAKLDVLKQNHQLKAKMQLSSDNYAVNWAWKRTQPLE